MRGLRLLHSRSSLYPQDSLIKGNPTYRRRLDVQTSLPFLFLRLATPIDQTSTHKRIPLRLSINEPREEVHAD